MKILLDRQSARPLYLQIRDRVQRLIRSGALQPGSRLPSIRALAREIRVSPLTVTEAYGMLEGDDLVYAQPGSGYFVRVPPAEVPAATSAFAPAQTVIIQEPQQSGFCEQFTASSQLQARPDLIDFSSGFPHLGEQKDFARLARRAVSQSKDTLLRYGLPQGQPILRQQITQLLVQQGLAVAPEQLLITNGSQQGLALAMQYYLKPGDWVIVESPTYHGAIALLETLGARIVGIPMQADGINLTLLEQYLHSHRPRLIYTISTLHNPTGITTPSDHRQQLIAIANRYDCLVLEDNAYEGLHFEPVPPPLKAFDPHDRVTYVGTFSKTLMPGLRVGYLVAPEAHRQGLLRQMLLHDFHVATLSQAVVSEYLATGYYRRHLDRLRMQNRQNRDRMLQALSQHFPDGTTWTIPQGGFFLWVHLPEPFPIQRISQAALQQGVLIACGSAFFPKQQGYPALRLNFSLPPEEIVKGIAILGRLLQQHRIAALRPDRASNSERKRYRVR
ncbi:PLP-dependent aminotransferase family protein [Romeria aff. gracilis LEGE 07310]|uniref:PLP-dependent aminotransferase family protein n=1 Tax=Vasconcelosia minhoensis LEGE 07310 TaxID=915328 RepID=A0A8J7DL45_9CYAN|nr:PLP-dependent aminotransferase family protein [Romeria gracilis]MBE9076956.1 PLP-dependent aminotransferase family protein [Romeria aff. gracilis LEGE 07310]